jgi:hypothetical protein
MLTAREGSIYPPVLGCRPQVELLSTQEQVLGGSSGQTYQECRFPCDEAYRLELMRHWQP